MSYYTNINTDITAHRQQLRNQLDGFATFMWQDRNMFDTFGMFIINDKSGNLKMYNGPSFSNEYIKPQFSSNNNVLSGVKFNIQTIEFQVGVYYFTIQEYRQLLEAFNAYEVSNLSFSFNPRGHYQVKLKNIADSPKHIVGSRLITGQHKNINNTSVKLHDYTEYYYYTELKLTFEIQGRACAYAEPYEGVCDIDTNRGYINSAISDSYHENDTLIHTDLDIPMDIAFQIQPDESTKGNIDFTISTNRLLTTSTQGQKEPQSEIALVHCKLHLDANDIQSKQIYYFHYYSEQGLMTYHVANEPDHLLTLMTTTASGRRLVELLDIHSFMISKEVTDLSSMYIDITVTNGHLVLNNYPDAQGTEIKVPDVHINTMAATSIF